MVHKRYESPALVLRCYPTRAGTHAGLVLYKHWCGTGASTVTGARTRIELVLALAPLELRCRRPRRAPVCVPQVWWTTCSSCELGSCPQRSQPALGCCEGCPSRASAEFRSMLGQSGPNWSNSGQLQPTLAFFGPNSGHYHYLSNFDGSWRIWAKLPQSRSKSSRVGPEFTKLGRSMAQLGQNWPKLGRISAQGAAFGQVTASELVGIARGTFLARVARNVSASFGEAQSLCHTLAVALGSRFK